MTTPPGPHAMTAQAGAVAVRCRVRGEQAWWYRSPDSFDPSHNPHLIEHEYLYPTPPAAVPVEALEGLVAGWRATANEAGKVAERATRKHLPDEWSEAKSQFIEQCADELTTLIKERSNG